MSDDYDDFDEPGGLWDPDAITAPPAPRRPALHAVPPPDLIEDEASSVDRVESSEESLVRLDQFRRVPDDEADFDERARRRWRRGRPLVAAAVIAGAMLATGLPGLTSEGRRAPKPAAARFFGADAEQAPTRTVQSAATGADHAPGGQRRAAHASTRARDSARASHRRQSAQTPRRGEALASGAATSSRPLTVAASQSPPTPPPSPTRSATRSSAAPASATSAEFSFER